MRIAMVVAVAGLIALAAWWWPDPRTRSAADRATAYDGRSARPAERPDPPREAGPDVAEEPPPPTVLEGWVRLKDGTPLARRALRLRAHPGVDGETDAAGNFRFEVERPGGAGLALLGPHGYEYALCSVVLERGRTTRREIELDPAIALSGRVLAPGPVAGAHVQLVAPFGREARHASVRTDADGRFAFPYLEAGPRNLQVTAAGFEPHARRVAPGPDAVEVRLRAARPLAIRLQDLPDDLRGRPVFWQIRGGLFALAGSTIPAGDAFTLDAPPPGAYVLSLHAGKPWLVSQRLGIETGSLPPVTFAVPRGARVTGTLRDNRGAPVGGARLLLGSKSARTDAAGRFDFPWVSAGRHPFRLRTLAGVVTVAEIDVPARGAVRRDVATRGLASVAFRVAAPDRVVATLRSAGGSTLALRPRDGRFRFRNLTPGRYELEVNAYEGGGARRTLELAAGEARDLGELALAPYPELPFFVTVPPGAALPKEIGVEVRNDEGGLLHRARIEVDDEGNGTLRGLPPGTHRAELGAVGFRPVDRILVVRPGETAPLPLALEKD